MKSKKATWRKSLLAVGATALTAASAGFAHADDSGMKLDVHGMVSTSFYAQTTPDLVYNGQGPLINLAEGSAHVTTMGFDVRQSRMNFTLSGAQAMGASMKGVLETDFFNLAGAGGYGEISLLPRLRLAYGEMDWGHTKVRFGQDWQLLFAQYPSSLAHMAFPVTYFAGLSGWRGVGVGVYQTTDMGDKSKLEAAVQVLRSDWENPTDFGQATTQLKDVSIGQLSGLPAFEARLKYSTADGFVYAAGHFGKADGSNAGYEPATMTTITGTRSFDIVEGKLGGQYNLGDFTLMAEGYIGMNTTPLIGEGLGWNTGGDVHEEGGWAQLAYHMNKAWTLAAVYGITSSSKDDVVAAGGSIYSNRVMGASLLYREGAFGFGPEFYQIETKKAVSGGAASADGVMDSGQLALTATYFF